MDIISRIFQKRGIKGVDELSAEEKGTFESWRKILAEGDVTVDKVKEFCTLQIGAIEEQFKNLDNTAQKNERLVLLHGVYSSILGAIEGPAQQREALVKYLTTLI